MQGRFFGVSMQRGSSEHFDRHCSFKFVIVVPSSSMNSVGWNDEKGALFVSIATLTFYTFLFSYLCTSLLYLLFFFFFSLWKASKLFLMMTRNALFRQSASGIAWGAGYAAESKIVFYKELYPCKLNQESGYGGTGRKRRGGECEIGGMDKFD